MYFKLERVYSEERDTNFKDSRLIAINANQNSTLNSNEFLGKRQTLILKTQCLLILLQVETVGSTCSYLPTGKDEGSRGGGGGARNAHAQTKNFKEREIGFDRLASLSTRLYELCRHLPALLALSRNGQ